MLGTLCSLQLLKACIRNEASTAMVQSDLQSAPETKPYVR